MQIAAVFDQNNFMKVIKENMKNTIKISFLYSDCSVSHKAILHVFHKISHRHLNHTLSDKKIESNHEHYNYAAFNFKLTNREMILRL